MYRLRDCAIIIRRGRLENKKERGAPCNPIA